MCLLLGKIITYVDDRDMFTLKKGRILDNPAFPQVGGIVNKYVVLIIREDEETDQIDLIYPYQIKSVMY
jgi:hypothetical protein